MQLVLSLLQQQMSVNLVIAYLFSKSPPLRTLANYSVRLPHNVLIYIIFSSFCILGTYADLDIDDAIANTRAVGTVLGDLLGGPLVGFLVELTGGLHRYTMLGFTDLACAISTTCEGLLGGIVHWRLMRAGKMDSLFEPRIVFFTTVYAEILQMREKFSRVFSARALNIANRTVGIMIQSFTPEASHKIARIIQEETGVGAVAITDTDKILALIGTGEDHHLPVTPIAITMRAIKRNKVLFADDNAQPYRCSLSLQCQLGSVLVIPLQEDKGVIGTIKLYEPKKRLFLKINHTLGGRGSPTCCHSGCWCNPNSNRSRPRSNPIFCSIPSKPSAPLPARIRARRGICCCICRVFSARISRARAALPPCRRSRSTAAPIWRSSWPALAIN